MSPIWWLYVAGVVLQLWALPALCWTAKRHGRRHMSSSKPYVELPRVSGRPAAGVLARDPNVRVIDRRAVGITTAEATDILCRAFAVPKPLPRPLQLFGPCPKCGTTATHLLGDRDTTTYSTEAGTVGPSIGRECLACGHEWKERLDG